jgi:hypothetical protein
MTLHTKIVIVVGSFMVIYTMIDIRVNTVTIVRENDPAADITSVFYCHKSNETDRTEWK